MPIAKVTDPKKIVTDELVLKELARQGIDKDYVEFFQDYAPRWRKRADGTSYRVKESSPYAKFYRDLKSGKKIMAVGGLPMVNADGVKICGNSHNETTVGWEKKGNAYHTKPNVFSARVINKRVTLNCINDQPWGAKKGETVNWQPRLFLNNGEISSIPEAPTLLPADPINENYHDNVLEWDYGICKRRIRVIEGRFRERWIFPANPNGDVRIKHNFVGSLKMGLGYATDAKGNPLEIIVTDDEEFIPATSFAGAVYPVEIGATDTFYPDDDPETSSVDGFAYYWDGTSPYASWSTLHNSAGTSHDDDNNELRCYFVAPATDGTTWAGMFRCIILFDTSGLPDGAVISEATLSVRVQAIYDNVSPALNVYSSNPASNTSVANADYQCLGTTPYSTEVACGDLTAGNYHDFTLNGSGVAAISKTGVSKFGTRESNYDAPNHQPSWEADKKSGADWYAADKGSGYEPKLVVTYTTVTAPIVTTQAADGVDCEAATLHGNITDNGGENCDERGFVWDTSSHGDPGNTAPSASAYGSNWTESNSYGTGAFSHGISGLPSGQIYYVRACAHNSAGWSYGGEVNFTTVGESSYETMVGSPTSWTWQKVDYESAEKCPSGSPTSWAWEAPTCKGADKTPQGSPTSFGWGSE